MHIVFNLNFFLYSFLNSSLLTIILLGNFNNNLKIVFLKKFNFHPLGEEFDLIIIFTFNNLHNSAQYKFA